VTTISVFSYLAATHTLHVAEYPRINYGVEVEGTDRFLAGDGPLVAAILAAFGHETTLFSNPVGSDPDGASIRKRLEGWGVRHRPTRAGVKQTRVNTVVADRAGNRTWFSGLAGIVNELSGIDLRQFTGTPAAYLDCYQVLGDTPQPVLEAALSTGQDVVVNLGGGPVPSWLPGTVAGRQLGVLQTNADEHDPADSARLIRELSGPDVAGLVVVTAGRAGATALTATGEVLTAAAVPVQVAQVQGAGAVFSATLMHARLADTNPARALTLACVGGSLWCSRRPHGKLPTFDEVSALARASG
jgi:sugar/nucleoside kinase (ribokinase family)